MAEETKYDASSIKVLEGLEKKLAKQQGRYRWRAVAWCFDGLASFAGPSGIASIAFRSPSTAAASSAAISFLALSAEPRRP